ncbi:Calcium-binding protein CBP [Linum perenne]
MSGYPYQPPSSGYGYGGPPTAQPYGGSSGHPQSQSHGSSPPPPQPYGSSGHPQSQSYGSGPPPPQPYGSSGYPQSQSYGSGPPPPQPYGSSAPYGSPQSHQQPHGAPSAPYAAPYGAPPPKEKPHSASSGQGGGGSGYPPSASYGSPFASLVPSAFPPGTDPSIVACFQMADQDGSGFIDDKELQRALSSYNQSFSLRTVHLLMYLFTNTNTRKIGPKEFTQVFYSLQSWRGIFERFDRDRSGKIDANELKEALLSLGFSVSNVVLQLLVSKFDKTGGRNNAIEYDNFIECCLTVKGLTEKFKEKDTAFMGTATFSYEAFMLTVLPFLVA